MGKPVPYDGFMQMVSIWLIVGQSGADMESAPTHEHRFYEYGRIWNPFIDWVKFQIIDCVKLR